ncbi:sensor domain-containing protein [Cohaesibacter intestini]|uniref:sensor domain-containing protein n=1 Tax=Cohaesibacter intestini TaxID=2211145 RepID=UPI000DEAFEE4|nr:bifunctional diguanylate cyclase/phosphodiesterase [Cohaesibacter intestini]
MFNITGLSWKRLAGMVMLHVLLNSLGILVALSLIEGAIAGPLAVAVVFAINGISAFTLMSVIKRRYRKHNAILTRIFDAMPDVVLAKDYDGNFVFCNETVASLYGAKPEDMVGKDDFHFTGNREQADFFLENVQAVMNRNQIEQVYEDSTDTETGEARHFQSLKIPFRDINGDPKIFVLAKDITDITKLKVEADRNKKRLQQVLDVSQEGLWEWNAKTNQVLHNHQWELITGVQGSDCSFAEFESCILVEDRSKVRQALQMLVERNLPYSIEFRMKRPDGKIIWVWDRGKVAEFDEAGQPLWLVGIVQDITEEKLNQEKITHLAYYDQLTGLANRTHLEEEVKVAIEDSRRRDAYNALLFMDLDRFKLLNDSHGHDMGDRLLQEVAKRLTNCVGAGDTIARFGGDEFVVLLTGIDATSEGEAALLAEGTAQAILNSFEMPFQLGEVEYSCSSSVGIAIFSTDDMSLDELLKQADMAMYDAKGAGRNAIRFFDPEMQTAAYSRAVLEADLKRDLNAGKLELYYQPQINSGGQIVGVEALLRWPHDDLGMVPPAEFIPIAESSGLILSLGDWILKTACLQLSEWAKDPILSKLVLSINVSPVQLHAKGFVRSVISALEESGAPADKLKIEITESMLVRNMDECICKMLNLKKYGVLFSLDDFGTGYSSLFYLKEMPLDQLKIDQSFVRDILIDPNDAAIAEMIVALGKTLGLSVIAEGVETEAQRVRLQQLGCHAYQGYLFARPMPLKDFALFTRSFNRGAGQQALLDDAVAFVA